jgi:hypothetical protein
MTRRVLCISIPTLVVLFSIFLCILGCQGSPDNAAVPGYFNMNPGDTPTNIIQVVYIEPVGVNLTVGGLQQFKAIAHRQDGTTEDVTNNVEWYTQDTTVGVFELTGGRFLAQHPGVAVVRCRVRLNDGQFLISAGAYVNSFNPDEDVPPAVVLNPSVHASPEGVAVWWDMNATDGDMAGYNIWRTQVSNAHYSTDYGRVNQALALYPPFLDRTVIYGWYYYRVTAEDLLGLHSAPSKEVAIFVINPGEPHYSNAYDGSLNSIQEAHYKDTFSTAF